MKFKIPNEIRVALLGIAALVALNKPARPKPAWLLCKRRERFENAAS
jgi:hypothetical protein